VAGGWQAVNIYPFSNTPNRPSGDARNINSDEVAYRIDVPLRFVPTPPWGVVGDNGGTIPIQYGAHPTVPGLLADTYSAEDLGGVQTLVRIKFSNNRQWRQANPPPDPTEQGYSSWSMSSDVGIVRIPYLLRVPEIITIPGGSTTKQVWEVLYEEVPEAGTITTWRGSLTTFAPGSAEALIHAQVDKIHQIPIGTGSKRLFLGATFDQRTTRWEAQYQWRIDHGTARPAEWVDTPTKVFPPTVATLGGVPYVRLPFESFNVIPSADPYNVAPTIERRKLKTEALNGWIGLGVPPP
jgi:hypothetical protein